MSIFSTSMTGTNTTAPNLVPLGVISYFILWKYFLGVEIGLVDILHVCLCTCVRIHTSCFQIVLIEVTETYKIHVALGNLGRIPDITMQCNCNAHHKMRQL